MALGLRLGLIVLLFLTTISCGSKRGLVKPGGLTPDGGTGLASWYGQAYHGRPTASGELFDMDKMTAAHRTLPFGTQVQVTNLENGRKAEVKINDRGPFVPERIIDLSYAAAKKLEMLIAGVVPVRLQLLFLPKGDSGKFVVQAGVFSNRDAALQLKERLGKKDGPVSITNEGTPWGPIHRVLVGELSKEEEAVRLADSLRREGLTPMVIRIEPAKNQAR